MTWEIHEHDCARPPEGIPEASIHTMITSPPYWGLRDYSRTDGPAPVPPSAWPAITFRPLIGTPELTVPAMDCHLGREPDPLAYTAHLVHAVRLLRPLLRADGTLWLNLGDTYATKPGKGDNNQQTKQRSPGITDLYPAGAAHRFSDFGVPEKNLVGIPWRAAFALQADGWIVRAAPPWLKKNAMPESAADRPSYAHEDVFLLTKQPDYYFDMFPVRRPVAASTTERDRYSRITEGKDGDYSVAHDHETPSDPAGRFWRTADFLPDGLIGDDGIPLAFNVPLQPYKGAHFAVFPPRLVEPIVRAATSDKGCCPRCGAPWRRLVARTAMVIERSARQQERGESGRTATSGTMVEPPRMNHAGWEPGCSCKLTCDCGSTDLYGALIGPHGEYCAAGKAPRPVPCRVLDPFAGAGTTLVVADAFNRHGVGFEVNPANCADIRHRLERPLARPRRVPARPAPAGPSLFDKPEGGP